MPFKSSVTFEGKRADGTPLPQTPFVREHPTYIHAVNYAIEQLQYIASRPPDDILLNEQPKLTFCIEKV